MKFKWHNNKLTFFGVGLSAPWLTCLILICISIVLRFLSFHFSVIDHDESTYLIIANELNKGQQLYTDVIDTKPAGIFLIFSGIQLLFGKSILALRLFSAIVLGLSGYLLTRISTQLKFSLWISFFNGVIFIVAFSAYRMGLSVNTELYFTFFCILALYLLLKAKQQGNYLLFFVAGLAIGLGFIIKYVVIAGFGAFSLYLLSDGIRNNRTKQSIFYIVLFGVGMSIPFLLLHLYFLSVSRFDDFYYATYEVVSRYSSDFSFVDTFLFFSKFHLSFFPFLIPFYWAVFTKRTPSTPKILATLWYIFAWVMVLLPGKGFKHYYLQLLPSVALLVPFGLYFILEKYNALRYRFHLFIFLLLTVISSTAINQSYFLTQKDIPRLIEADIKETLNEDDLVWSDKKYHITYYLLNLAPPTKYVHPSLMFEHTKALQIDTEKEANNILNQQPRYIIHQSNNGFFLNFKRIQEEYTVFKHYDKVVVLTRKEL